MIPVSGNYIGDFTIIDDHVWLSSHVCIAGHVKIEALSFLGNNCTISNHITLAQKSFIGANALVTKSTIANGVYLAPGSATRAPLESDKFMKFIKLD